MPSSRLSPRLVRRLLLVLFVLGIAGMIVGSIRDNNGIAITFGLVTAFAAVCLMIVSAIVPPAELAGRAVAGVDEAAAADLEARIEQLVRDGADEHALRVLVRRAVELGRGATAAPVGAEATRGDDT